MKKILFFLFVSCLSYNAYTQNDFRDAFVITNDNDTISGLVAYRDGGKNFQRCDFKRSENVTTIIYKPDQIKGYQFLKDRYFVSRNIQNNEGSEEKVFLEVLVEGNVSLYRYRNTFYIEKKGSALSKLSNEKSQIILDGKKVTKTDNSYIGILAYLLSDCEALKSKVPIINLREKELTRLIRQYGNCTNQPTRTFKEKKPWFAVSIGALVGVSSSQIEFQSNFMDITYLGKFARKTLPVTGLQIILTPQRISERISFYTNFLYIPVKYESSTAIAGPIAVNTNFITIDVKQVKIPFGFRYVFLNTKISPYLNFGISNTVHLDISANRLIEKDLRGNITFSESEAFPTKDIQLGYWGGIGIMKKITPKLNGYLEIRYEQTNGVAKRENIVSPELTSDIINLNFLVGLSF